MRISNIIFPCIAVCLCGSSAGLRADELTFSGGEARMTGRVRSINDAGVVELESPLSPEPVLLKSSAVGKVEFTPGGDAVVPPGSMIELANGDILPATVESMDERILTVVSPEAGRLEIPRELVACAQFGIRQRKVLYTGPLNLEEWTGGEGDKKNWSFEHGSLVANGQAAASKNLPLPQQFIIRFTLKWQLRQIPNFRIYFADPLVAKGEACDRYLLQFGAAGLEMKRESTKGRHFSTIVQLNRTPNQYPEHQLPVEIRVDRKGSRLHLFLNDQPEGEFVDPVSPTPTANGIALECNSQSGGPQEISGIEILEYDDSRGRHHDEERGNAKSDSLISRDEDRWGGHLLEIRKKGDAMVFRFKSDFQKDPLEIPETDVSTVFFAKKDTPPAGAKAPPFVIRLRGKGSLGVTSCRFADDGISAVHPLLGPLSLHRDGVVSLERPDAVSKNAKPAGEP